MKRKEAIDRVVKYSPRTRDMVAALEHYEKGMSSGQFASKAKISISNAWRILNQYKIPLPGGNNRTQYCKNIERKWRENWNEKETMSQNIKRIGVTRSGTQQAVSRYNLKYESCVLDNKNRRGRFRRILHLTDNGVTDSEIGRILNLTRERVRQLINDIEVKDLRAKLEEYDD